MSSKTYRLRAIADTLRRQRGACWLCGQPIDYSLPHDHPMAFTVDHVMPRSTHPHLENDPANTAPAHAKCNKARGSSTPSPGLGNRSRDW